MPSSLSQRLLLSTTIKKLLGKWIFTPQVLSSATPVQVGRNRTATLSFSKLGHREGRELASRVQEGMRKLRSPPALGTGCSAAKNTETRQEVKASKRHWWGDRRQKHSLFVYIASDCPAREAETSTHAACVTDRLLPAVGVQFLMQTQGFPFSSLFAGSHLSFN